MISGITQRNSHEAGITFFPVSYTHLVLPVDRLSNINYGQRNGDDSPTKILALKGIGNGFSNILYFRRKAGEWELYKFEDTSI